MNKVKVIMVALAMLAIPLLAFAGTAQAAGFHSGPNVTFDESEVIDHTVFVAGSNLDIKGTINGDVFCAGQNVRIDATVTGDVICAGMNVQIGGNIEGDVRAAGQNVTVSAVVGSNATLAGNNVTLEEQARVGRDLQAAGEAVTVEGNVARDLDVAGSTVTINGTIGRDAQAASERVMLGDDAVLNGNLTYYSHNQLNQASGAQVAGEIAHSEPEMREKHDDNNAVGNAIFSFVILLTLAFVLLALFPRVLGSITNNGLQKPGMTALIGVGVTILTPLAIVVSFLTVIGVYVGLALLLGWLIVLLFSGVFASYLIGRLIFTRSPQHPFVMMLTGVVAISVLLLVPVLNVLTGFAVVFMGGGMAVREFIKRMPKPNYETPALPKTSK